jgi:branched-chain amino acid transport system permease protein
MTRLAVAEQQKLAAYVKPRLLFFDADNTVAFYGAGAYTVAILARLVAWPFAVGILAAGLVAVVLALILGSVTLRLRGIYFAIATLAFTEMVRAVVHRLPTRIGGGGAGLNVPALFRPQFIAGEMARWEVAFLRNQAYFYTFAALLLLAIVMSLIVQHTRLRAAFTAVRTNEQVAAVMGVQPAKMKLLAFVFSSVLVGLLGAVEGHRIGSVNPGETFGVGVTVLGLVTPIFGGLYTTIGPLLGAGFLAGLEEVLRRNMSDGYLIGYGIVLVLAILFMPRGLVGLFYTIKARLQRRS